MQDHSSGNLLGKLLATPVSSIEGTLLFQQLISAVIFFSLSLPQKCLFEIKIILTMLYQEVEDKEKRKWVGEQMSWREKHLSPYT